MVLQQSDERVQAVFVFACFFPVWTFLKKRGRVGCMKSILHRALGALFLAGAFVAAAADQPQFGQRYTRNMVSDETNLPDSFDPASGKNLKWQVPLGTETYSTPVVSGGRVFIGTNNELPRNPNHKGDLGVLLCLDEKDGQMKWQSLIPKREGDMFLDWPRSGMPSPATVEGNRVYMNNNRGVVMCLDIDGMANGNDGPFKDEASIMVHPGEAPTTVDPTDADVLWTFDLTVEAGIHSHDGAHSSILVYGDFLYLNTGNGVDNTHRKIRSPEAPSLVVLDKKTGRWLARDNEHIGPNIFHSTWSSPALGEVNGRTLIFFCGGNGVVYAFEPLKEAPPEGKVLNLTKVWEFDFDPTAPKEDVHRFTGNRKESPSNIKSMPVFDKNRLYVTGGGDVWWGKNQAWLKCIDATGTGNITTNGLKWSYPLERHCMATPTVYQGMVFVGDCGGKIHCVDAQTGKPYWVHDGEGEIWSSALVADGRVYVGTREGTLWTLAASKEKQVLAKVQLDGPIHATPVAANGVLYVATMKHLYAARKEAAAVKP